MAVADRVEFNLNTEIIETIGIYLFATSVEEAVELAIVRRDRATEQGDW